MKVWLLWESWISGPDLLGIYSTEEKAESAKEARVGMKEDWMHHPVVENQLDIDEIEVQ